jgi:hypothetical protein
LEITAGGKMNEKKWIFNGCCPEVSPLGTVLRTEVEKIRGSGQNLSDDEIRRLALVNLGTRAESKIDAEAFLELGAEEYLLQNREVAARVRDLVMGLPVVRNK